ncbi:GntR family transcriptional regulator [Streptomyces sp. NPDC058086]|uniref:GntR family transcriptional regulator n=1 Tax=Streptomyces sp. NPDC058086 TaxID=3346334 RepID=UPI0036ECD3E7
MGTQGSWWRSRRRRSYPSPGSSPPPPSPPRPSPSSDPSPSPSPSPTAATRVCPADHGGDAGRLRPGDRLVEHELAECFGVSQVPGREAIRALVTEGYSTALRFLRITADYCV